MDVDEFLLMFYNHLCPRDTDQLERLKVKVAGDKDIIHF